MKKISEIKFWIAIILSITLFTIVVSKFHTVKTVDVSPKYATEHQLAEIMEWSKADQTIMDASIIMADDGVITEDEYLILKGMVAKNDKSKKTTGL